MNEILKTIRNAYKDFSSFTETIDKCAELLDLEERDLLIKLPCKVGDTVYELVFCDDGQYRIFKMTVGSVCEYGSVRWVKGIHPTVWNIFLIRDYSTYSYKTFYDFGTTLFLTYEEAKEKLKEVK